MSKILIIFTLFAVLLSANPVFAQIDTSSEFDYNLIISDEVAQDYNSMSVTEIQNFLQTKNSYLQSYVFFGYNPAPGEIYYTKENDPDGNLRLINSHENKASEIIYNAAQEAKINPKFLLVTLQKEMGLISFDINYPVPSERALDYAMGYACFERQACDAQYKGFGKQVRSAALQFRWYIDNIEGKDKNGKYYYSYRPGVSVCIDDILSNKLPPCTPKGTLVTPANRITAAMYVYTPHIQGSKSVYDIWKNFGFEMVAQLVKPLIPYGAVVQAKSGEDTKSIYLIKDGKKMLFANNSALISRYDPKKVQKIDQEEIAKFPDGPEIKYPNYSILENPIGQRYLIDGLVKRLIASKEVFRQLGFSVDEIVDVVQSDLDTIPDGSELTADVKYPLGKLLRSTKTNGVYYVKDNIKSPIIDPVVISLNFPTLKIASISQATLETYNDDLPVTLNDGTLVKVKNEANVYVISDGQRRWISDAETFNNLGYSWANIKTISERVLNLHDAGENLKI